MKRRRGLAGPFAKRTSRPVPRRLVVEQCEDRLLMATFTVTVNADSGPGSLRAAITAVNDPLIATQASNTINFAIAANQPITPLSPLPPITRSNVVVDGTSSDGGRVEINGSNTALGSGDGLTVTGQSVTLRDLVIDQFKGNGITLSGLGGDSVLGCYIGTDPTGLILRGNTGSGISDLSRNNFIGGAGAADRNVITGNQQAQISIGATASGTRVVSNYIGVNATGVATLPPASNVPNGIEISSNNNTIGGIVGSTGNVISGNNYGISIATAGANANVISGNYIGTNAAGTVALPNTQYGIYVSGPTDTVIGGATRNLGNLVSGNSLAGILIQGSTTTNTQIYNNSVGLSSANAALPNGTGTNGLGGIVLLNTAPSVYVGTPPNAAPGTSFGNTIAFNTGATSNGAGITVDGGTGASILGNSIYQNSGPGILLKNNGNGGIAPPTLAIVQSSATDTYVAGTFLAPPSSGPFPGSFSGPFRVQFFANSTPNPSGRDGQTFIGEGVIPPQPAGGIVSFAISFPTSLPQGTQVTATVSQSQQGVTNTSQFSTSLPIAVASDPDLEVTTSTNPPTPQLLQPFVYTVRVRNIGQSTATGVVLTDLLPSNAGFQASSNGTLSSDKKTLTVDVGSLDPGQTYVLTITVVPSTSGVTISNTASAFGSVTLNGQVSVRQHEPNFQNNVSATVSDPTATVADLSVYVNPVDNPVAVGAPLSFVVTVLNSGPSVASHVVTTVTLPSSLINYTVTIDPESSYQQSGNVVTINSGVVPGAHFSFPIMIAGIASQVGQFSATASVKDVGGIDSNTTNNTASATVRVANSADLAVTMVPANPTPLLGEDLLYTIVVTNNGPSIARAPILTDLVPSGLTYDPNGSSTNSGSLAFDGTKVTAALDALAPNASATIVLAFRPSIIGPVTNSVTVAHSQTIIDPTDPNVPPDIDTVPTNNTATSTVLVGLSDVGVAIQGPADPLSINGPAIYTILVTNNGPAAAPNVVLNDVLGAGAIIVGASAPQGTVAFGLHTLTAKLGTIPAGQTIAVQMTVNPLDSVLLTNNASVATDGFDSNTANNTASSTNQVSPVDLAVTMTGPSSPVLLGQQATFVVTVTNNGPSPATNARIADLLPTNTSLVSATVSQGSVGGSGLLLTEFGTLASGASATLTITVTANGVGPFTNLASAASNNLDTNSGNDSASATGVSFNQPGTIVLVPVAATVNENGGSIAFTIERILGSLGAVSINYATSDLSARSGLNYVGLAGTIVFADGDTSPKMLTIPILDDNIIGGDVNFLLSLSNPQGGATLSPQSAAVVTVANTDRDFVAPKVVSVDPVGTKAGINSFVITFDDAMDPTRASDPNNYRISLSGRDPGQMSGSDVQIAGAVFDPVHRTVTLTPVGNIPTNRFYQVRLVTTGPQPLTDTSGNVLDGNGDGVAGGDYETLIGQGTRLKYRDARDNVVTLSLTKGGSMTVIRDASGNASTVALGGIVPRRSTLSGSVKRGKHGGGRVTIGTITGLRKFGDVKSNLTTAPFFAIFAPVNVNGQVKSNTAPPATTTASAGAARHAGSALKAAAVPHGPRSF